MGEWFRDSSQAFGANRRVQRAPGAADSIELELRRVALHSMACRAAAANPSSSACIDRVAAEASARSALYWHAVVWRRVDATDTARRVRPAGASGTEWTLLTPRDVSCKGVRLGRRVAFSLRCEGASRSLITNCARTCCSQRRVARAPFGRRGLVGRSVGGAAGSTGSDPFVGLSRLPG